MPAGPGMRVIVTGGGGFLGRYLIQTLIRRRILKGRTVEAIAVLDAGRDTQFTCDTDVKVFPNRPMSMDKVSVENYTGDITDKQLVTEVFKPRRDGQLVTVFHLASVLSGQGEKDFDHCMAVNVDGTRSLLEVARTMKLSGAPLGGLVKFVFPSSIAAFGSQRVVSDDTRLLPESTYGTTKAIMEMIINDYTRKGWVDGRTGRLPTVIVRPGSPNQAATGCFSALVREVLRGDTYHIPLDPQHVHPVCSISTVIKGMIALAEVPASALGHNRAVNFPALAVTLDEVLFHTQQIAHARGIPVGDARVEIDANVSRIVKAMPSLMHSPRAAELGLPSDKSLEEIVDAYVEEFLSDEMEYPALGSPEWGR